MAIGHQSFYQTQLTSAITDTDLVIPLDTVPTVSEGFLVIESTVEAKREIIYFTSKDGTSVTVPSGAGNGRGYDGTTAVSHLQGATVIMAPVGAMFDKLGDISVNSITINDTTSAEGWSPLGDVPDTVTANGNNSYDLVFNSNDLTDTITPGMRLRTARTVAAPIQSTSLNGTTQYYSKSSPAGMTFTDDFCVSAWVKLSSYSSSANQVIVSRYNGTSGWKLQIRTEGTVDLVGLNAGSTNFRRITSYQSIPLNKWVHISAQLDMSAHTATTTTSYVMLDGVDVPAVVGQGGTNPTALIQAGNLEVGSGSATEFFGGKIAQVAIYSAKVTQATHLAAMNQGLTGSETNLVSAYSLSNSLNDLSANANNLTANGSATTTNADSPFGNSGVSTTLDYGIVMDISFSTNTTLTVQVPEGCTLPTTGGITSIDYSTQNVPYGFPRSTTKWILSVPIIAILSTSGTSTSTTYNPGGIKITVPIGAWLLGYQMQTEVTTSASVVDVYSGLSTSASDMSLLPYLVSRMTMNLASGTGATLWNNNKEDSISISAQTPYYAVIRSTAAFSAAQIRGSSPTATGSESTVLYVKNAYV